MRMKLDPVSMENMETEPESPGASLGSCTSLPLGFLLCKTNPLFTFQLNIFLIDKRNFLRDIGLMSHIGSCEPFTEKTMKASENDKEIQMG